MFPGFFPVCILSLIQSAPFCNTYSYLEIALDSLSNICAFSFLVAFFYCSMSISLFNYRLLIFIKIWNISPLYSEYPSFTVQWIALQFNSTGNYYYYIIIKILNIFASYSEFASALVACNFHCYLLSMWSSLSGSVSQTLYSTFLNWKMEINMYLLGFRCIKFTVFFLMHSPSHDKVVPS